MFKFEDVIFHLIRMQNFTIKIRTSILYLKVLNLEVVIIFKVTHSKCESILLV